MKNINDTTIRTTEVYSSSKLKAIAPKINNRIAIVVAALNLFVYFFILFNFND